MDVIQSLFYGFALVYVAMQAYAFVVSICVNTDKQEREVVKNVENGREILRNLPHLPISLRLKIIQAIFFSVPSDRFSKIALTWIMIGLFTPQYLQFGTLAFFSFSSAPIIIFLSPLKYGKYFFLGIKPLAIFIALIIFNSHFHCI